MSHCKDCKHWGTGKPQRMANYSPKRHCAVIVTNDADSLAMISVGGDIEHGDYPADLLTHPNFGCVLWEAKE